LLEARSACAKEAAAKAEMEVWKQKATDASAEIHTLRQEVRSAKDEGVYVIFTRNTIPALTIVTLIVLYAVLVIISTLVYLREVSIF